MAKHNASICAFLLYFWDDKEPIMLGPKLDFLSDFDSTYVLPIRIYIQMEP